MVACNRVDSAPGIVGVLDDCGTTCVQKRYNIALDVGDIVVVCAAIFDGHGRSTCIVSEVEDPCLGCGGTVRRSGRNLIYHLHQASAGVDIAVLFHSSGFQNPLRSAPETISLGVLQGIGEVAPGTGIAGHSRCCIPAFNNIVSDISRFSIPVAVSALAPVKGIATLGTGGSLLGTNRRHKTHM